LYYNQKTKKLQKANKNKNKKQKTKTKNKNKSKDSLPPIHSFIVSIGITSSYHIHSIPFIRKFSIPWKQ